MPAPPSHSVTNPSVEQARELSLGDEVIIEGVLDVYETIVSEIIEQNEEKTELHLDDATQEYRLHVDGTRSRMRTA